MKRLLVILSLFFVYETLFAGRADSQSPRRQTPQRARQTAVPPLSVTPPDSELNQNGPTRPSEQQIPPLSAKEQYENAGFIDPEAMVAVGTELRNKIEKQKQGTYSPQAPTYKGFLFPETQRPYAYQKPPFQHSSFIGRFLSASSQAAHLISSWAWAPALVGFLGMTYASGLPSATAYGIPSLIGASILKRLNILQERNNERKKVDSRYFYNGREMALTQKATVFVPEYTVTDTAKEGTRSIPMDKQQHDYNLLLEEERKAPGSLAAKGIDINHYKPNQGRKEVYHPTTTYRNTTFVLDLNKMDYTKNPEFKTKEDRKESLLREELSRKHPVKQPELNIKITSLVKHPEETSSWEFVRKPHKEFPAAE